MFWRRLIDSCVPTHSPAALAGLTVHLARPRGSVLCSSRRRQNKTPSISRHAGRSVLATSYSRTAYRRTTIGAAAFHCRVRNGNGWGHCAMITRGPSRTGSSLLRSEAGANRRLWGPRGDSEPGVARSIAYKAKFQKNYQQSTKSLSTSGADSLASTYRKRKRTLRLRFV